MAFPISQIAVHHAYTIKKPIGNMAFHKIMINGF